MQFGPHRIALIAFAALACVAVPALGPTGGQTGLQAHPPGIQHPVTRCQSSACLKATYALARGNYKLAAENLERHLHEKRLGEVAPSEFGDLLVLAAHALEKSGAHRKAAGHWIRAGAMDDNLESYFRYRALKALLEASPAPGDWLKSLRSRGVADHTYPDAELTRLRLAHAITGHLPEAEVIEAALQPPTRDEGCRWLAERLKSETEESAESESAGKRRTTGLNLWWGSCPTVEEANLKPPSNFEPAAEARLRRGEELYSAVRYSDALEELEQIDLDALPPATRCRAKFRTARTLYRLDRYNAAEKRYRGVVTQCDRDDSVDPRIRSLYAIGRRNFFRGRLETARKAWETILEDYPERSHADDALLFLGRIAGKHDDRERQRRLLKRALEEYPSGDMVSEFAWEYLEPLYRDGEDAAYIKAVDSLPLPEGDQQYFSQGRISYFLGRVHQRNGDTEEATRVWQAVWETYPFSFYGYLSHLQLRKAGVTPSSLDGPEAEAPADWFYDTTWNGSGVRRLLDLGLKSMAVDVEAARLAGVEEPSARDWWRLAALRGEAGDFHISHQIPRNLIPGRPWTSPAEGRVSRWQVAFPDAFEAAVDTAVEVEAKQAGTSPVASGLIRALIREESGFRPDVVSWAGAVGLMQLMPATARNHDGDIDGTATVEKLKKAKTNVRVGVDHMFWLAKRLDAHPVAMVAAYNAGIGAVGSWLDGSSDIALWVEDIPYRQTRHYAKRVIGSYAAYQWLDGTRRLDESVLEGPPTK